MSDDTNYVAMTGGEMYQACGDDASKWAEAFCQIASSDNPMGNAMRAFPNTDRDELHSSMMSWFANAMMAQVDFQNGKQPVLCGDPCSMAGRPRDHRMTAQPTAVEAMARAMCVAVGDNPDREGPWAEWWQDSPYTAAALAALKALRDGVTPGMVEAGEKEAQALYADDVYFADCFHAMIDAAIEEAGA